MALIQYAPADVFQASTIAVELLRAARAGKHQPGDERLAVMAIQGRIPAETVAMHLREIADRFKAGA